MGLLGRFQDFLLEFHSRYPGVTARGLQRFTDAHGRSSYAAFAEVLLHDSGDAPNVLDIGCGDGVLLEEIRKIKPSAALTGIDLVASDIATARERLPGATLYVDDLTTHPFAASVFDVIGSHLVLMLSGPLEPAIVQVARALKPGGTFAFVVDDLNAPGGEFAALMSQALAAAGTESATSPFKSVVDRRLYDETELRALLSEHGLRLQTSSPHVLSADLDAVELWDLFTRMYQIGTLPDQQRLAAHRALDSAVGPGVRTITFNFRLFRATKCV